MNNSWAKRERRNKSIAVALSIALHVALIAFLAGAGSGDKEGGIIEQVREYFSPEEEQVETAEALVNRKQA